MGTGEDRLLRSLDGATALRRLVTIAAMAWLGASAWAASSLPPMGKVLASSDRPNVTLRIEAFTAAGQIVVSRFVNVNSGTYVARGPVTVHDPQTGAVIVSALTGDDNLIAVHWTGRWGVVSRGPMTALVSLEDGSTLIEHPHAAWRLYRSGALSPSGSRFLVEANEGVIVWDVASKRRLATFEGLRAPIIGDDNTFFASRPISTRDGPIQHEPVRVDIDDRTVTKDDRRPIYDCGIGLCSPSGEYGVYFMGNRPAEGLSIFHNGRMEPAWKLDLRRTSSSVFFLDNPGISFSDDSQEVRLRYQAGRHAIGVARWKTSDGTPLSPLPDETQPVQGFVVTASDGHWSARLGYQEERFPKWIPPSVQKWLLSTAPVLMSKLAPEQRIEIIDNRWDRIAAVVPQQANSVRFMPDSRSFLIDNQRDLVRYNVPAGRFLGWCLWGILPSALIIGCMRRRSPTR